MLLKDIKQLAFTIHVSSCWFFSARFDRSPKEISSFANWFSPYGVACKAWLAPKGRVVFKGYCLLWMITWKVPWGLTGVVFQECSMLWINDWKINTCVRRHPAPDMATTRNIALTKKVVRPGICPIGMILYKIHYLMNSKLHIDGRKTLTWGKSIFGA